MPERVAIIKGSKKILFLWMQPKISRRLYKVAFTPTIVIFLVELRGVNSTLRRLKTSLAALCNGYRAIPQNDTPLLER